MRAGAAAEHRQRAASQAEPRGMAANPTPTLPRHGDHPQADVTSPLSRRRRERLPQVPAAAGSPTSRPRPPTSSTRPRSAPCAATSRQPAACRPSARRSCSCRRSPRPRSASICAAATASPRTWSRSATRPTSSTTAGSASPTATSASSTGSRPSSPPPLRRSSTDSGADRVQLVGWCLGGIMSLLSVADQPRRGRLDRDGREPVRLRPGAADGAGAPARGPHGRRGRHRALPGARRRTRARSSAHRLPAHLDRPLPDEARWCSPQSIDNTRGPRPDRGDRPLHGEHDRLPRPHLRPDLPSVLPHQRALRRPPEIAGGEVDISKRRASRSSRSPAAATYSPRRPRCTTSATSSVQRPTSCASRRAPGGHLGVLTGSARPSGTTWQYLDEFLLETQDLGTERGASAEVASRRRR